MLTNFGLNSLLRIICYGLDDIVMAARTELTILDTITRSNGLNGSRYLVPPDALIINCTTYLGFADRTALRKAIYNKRFFIGLINHVNNTHYTGFI